MESLMESLALLLFSCLITFVINSEKKKTQKYNNNSSTFNPYKNNENIKFFPDNKNKTFKYQNFFKGKLWLEKNYTNGILTNSKYFHLNSDIVSLEKTFSKTGLLMEFTNFDENGNITFQIINNLLENTSTILTYKNNICIKKSYFKNDCWVSNEIFYDSDALKSKAVYDNSIGTQIDYSETGEILEEFEVCNNYRVEKLENGRIRFIALEEEIEKENEDEETTVITTFVERDLTDGIYKYITPDYIDEVGLKNGEFHGIYKRHYINEKKNIIKTNELYKFENGKFVEIYNLEDLDNIFSSEISDDLCDNSKYIEECTKFTFDSFSKLLSFKIYKNADNIDYLANIYYLKPYIDKVGYYMMPSFHFINNDKSYYTNRTLKMLKSYNDEGDILSAKKYSEIGRILEEITVSDPKNCVGKLIKYLKDGKKSITHFTDGKFSEITLIYDEFNNLIEQKYID